LTLERLSTVYKVKLSTDGFGHVVASASDAMAAAEDEWQRRVDAGSNFSIQAHQTMRLPK
jgi:hypothetical protein